MKILLDTHVFLWGIQDESRVPHKVQSIIHRSESWLSVASIWEILTKVQLGKLNLPRPAGPYIEAKMKINGVQVLAVTLDHVLKVEDLPLHHRDPFDRLLIAQSSTEKWPIVTSDPWFSRYQVDVIW